MLELWTLIALVTLTTYAWRGLGVLLSGRISTDSEFFNWVACVAYAMVAGLIMRIILMPTGVLAESLLTHRLLSCALGLTAFYLFRRNLFVAVGVGAASLTLLDGLRDWLG